MTNRSFTRRDLAATLLLAPAVRLFGQRPLLELNSDKARVAVDLAGGSIVDFRLLANPVNPLVWESPGTETEPRPRGHFLCLDRWGQPSEAELKNGMPFHGEATRVVWRRINANQGGDGTAVAMRAELPMAGLAVERTLALQGAAFGVTERVTNRNNLGRMYNMVQHPTIGGRFLDAQTVVDANARQGFMQSSPLPNPEMPAVVWPSAQKDAELVDLRRLKDDPAPNVVSFVIDDELGWVTAASPSTGLLIGYLWRTREYPWLNIWRHVTDGKPAARGLEFGTTGLHQPFPVLAKKGRIFGRPLYLYLDAGETHERSYLAFLSDIPGDYSGVARLSYDGKSIQILERAPAGRERVVAAGEMLPGLPVSKP